MAKYICTVCGYIYDEEKEGVLFKDLPNEFVCPLCGASKDLFKMEVESKDDFVLVEEDVSDLKELSDGAMACLCSNLAKGATKQYLFDEAKLFDELASKFSLKAGSISDADFKEIKELIKYDYDVYERANNTAKSLNDRAALRALVWTEKVTRMMDSILSQYDKLGDKILDGKDIYICEVCGFIYIGNDLPKVCPVCKVPNFKMHKVGEYNGK